MKHTEHLRAPGTPSLVRMKMTFFNQGPDKVRQLGEQSGDGGATYSTQHDLIYRRRKPAATR